MQRFPRLFAPLALGSALGLSSCGGGGSASQYSYQNVTIAISPQPASIAAGSSVTFTATTTNAPNHPDWFLLSAAYANLGSSGTQLGGGMYQYIAPAQPPIYTGAGTSNVPGTVTLQATTPNSLTSFTAASTQITFVITAPAVTVGISPATAALSLNATQQFTIYAVGSVNNGLTLQVNGVTGGSAATGTIVRGVNSLPATYVYTAPAAMPMSGGTVTLLAISQADPTKTAFAQIQLKTP